MVAREVEEKAEAARAEVAREVEEKAEVLGAAAMVVAATVEEETEAVGKAGAVKAAGEMAAVAKAVETAAVVAVCSVYLLGLEAGLEAEVALDMEEAKVAGATAWVATAGSRVEEAQGAVATAMAARAEAKGAWLVVGLGAVQVMGGLGVERRLPCNSRYSHSQTR